MGPEFDHLKQATVCIQNFIEGYKKEKTENGMEDSQMIIDSNNHYSEYMNNEVLEKLSEITMALTKVMESQKSVNEVLTGTMKCTSCGATSVGLCNDSRASEERRKISEEEDEDDDKTTSSGVSRIASVDSIEPSLLEQSIKSVCSSISAPADEEESLKDEDLIVQTIFNSTKDQVMSSNQTSEIDALIQSSLFQNFETIKEENEDVIETMDDKNVISNILEKIFGTQSFSEFNDTPKKSKKKKESPIESPAAVPFDSFGALEALFNDSMNGFEPSTSEAKASRKRKNTPTKVPKPETPGGGYVCPMPGCNKVFKEKGSVHRHYVTHIGMRFNCDKCKASYTQKHALMLHQKIHANPDAYQCRGCGTNYTTQNGLRLHRQRNPACMEIANDLQRLRSSSPSTINNSDLPSATDLASIADILNVNDMLNVPELLFQS